MEFKHFQNPAPQQAQTYWSAVQLNREQLEATGERYFYVTSLDSWRINSTAGSTTQVNLENAARGIARESHRLSTDAEIKAHLEAQEKNRKEMVQEKMRRANTMVMLTPHEAFGLDAPEVKSNKGK